MALEDPEEDEEDEEEEEEGCLSRAPGQLVVQAPYRLPDVRWVWVSRAGIPRFGMVFGLGPG